jgi:CENP-S protein
MSIMDHSHALNDDDDDEEAALRMAVKHAVWKICSASSGGGTNYVLRINNNGIDRDDGMLDEPPLDNNIPSSRLTPQALAVLSELTFQYAVSCLAPDLDAFSTHAGRRQRIVLADVLLAVRKKETVQRRVSDAVENAAATTTTTTTTASATKPTKASSTSRRSAATKSAATSKPAKESDYDDSSSEGDLAARLRGQPPYAPMTKKLNHYGSSSSSSSSEIESDPRWAKKVKHQSSASKLASTNQRRPQQTKARFRLPSLANDNQNRDPNAAAAAKWSDSDDSSQSSSLGDHGGAAAQTTTNTTTTRANNTASCTTTTTTTQSRVESIVANLSLDSLPSDVENGNHDGF